MSIREKIFSLVSDGNGPSLDTMLAQFDKELENFSSLVQPAPESKPRTPFDSPHIETNKFDMISKPSNAFRALPVMLPLVYLMRRSAKMYDGTFQPTSQEATPEFINQLENSARAGGAKDIRYIKVPNNAIFRDKGLPYRYAIVFTVEMDKDNMSTAPSFEAFLEVAKGYKRLAVISSKLAKLMRRNGFAAYPGTALGGITDYVYLAELAGLGASGYHGLLITPHEGARVRINTVYTNITNLPVESDGENEHLWVRDFCAMCKKCIRECPVDAIYPQPVPRGDGGMQAIDHASCRDYFNANMGCGICLAMCPFSQAGYAEVKSRFKGNPKAPQFRIPVATNLEADQPSPVEMPEKSIRG